MSGVFIWFLSVIIIYTLCCKSEEDEEEQVTPSRLKYEITRSDCEEDFGEVKI
jgi:hypothetical protein